MRAMQVIIALCLLCLSFVAADEVTDQDAAITGNFTEILQGGNLTTYTPSSIVTFFHSMPHWTNPKPGVVGTDPDATFKSGNDPETKTYLMSLIGFPTLLFCFGIMALLCLQLGMLGYFDWAVPKLGPVDCDRDAGTNEIALWTHKVEMSRKMWVIYFFVALFIGFFGNHIMFYGDDVFNKGFNVVMDSLNTMEHMVKDIGDSSEHIAAAFKTVETMAVASADTCPQMSDPQISILIDNEYEALGDMSFKTEIIREAVVTGQKSLKYYNNKKITLLWVFYAISLGVLLCFVGCFFTKQSFFMNISIIVCQIVMVGLLGLCTFELIFMMGLSDFCMSPTEAVVDALDGQDILQRTAKFYSVCDPASTTGDGDNFIHRSLADSYEKRRQLGRSLQILYMPTGFLDPEIARSPDVPACGPTSIDKNVQMAFYALQGLASDFQGLAVSTKCAAMHDRWRLTFEVALCKNTLDGVYYLWWAQIITTIGLFLTSLTSSIMMLYFDAYWDISTTMANKVADIKEHEYDFAVESDTTDSNQLSVGTRSDGYTPVASTSV